MCGQQDESLKYLDELYKQFLLKKKKEKRKKKKEKRRIV